MFAERLLVTLVACGRVENPFRSHQVQRPGALCPVGVENVLHGEERHPEIVDDHFAGFDLVARTVEEDDRDSVVDQSPVIFVVAALFGDGKDDALHHAVFQQMQILELDLCGFARLGDQDVESLLLEDLLYLDDDAREKRIDEFGYDDADDLRASAYQVLGVRIRPVVHLFGHFEHQPFGLRLDVGVIGQSA